MDIDTTGALTGVDSRVDRYKGALTGVERRVDTDTTGALKGTESRVELNSHT